MLFISNVYQMQRERMRERERGGGRGRERERGGKERKVERQKEVEKTE